MSNYIRHFGENSWCISKYCGRVRGGANLSTPSEHSMSIPYSIWTPSNFHSEQSNISIRNTTRLPLYGSHYHGLDLFVPHYLNMFTDTNINVNVSEFIQRMRDKQLLINTSTNINVAMPNEWLGSANLSRPTLIIQLSDCVPFDIQRDIRGHFTGE